MNDQRLPLAFAASDNIRHCEERDGATKQSPAGDASLPARDCFASLAMTANGFDPQRTALILTGAEHPPLPEGRGNEELHVVSAHPLSAAPTDFAVLRHAGSAAAAQAGACGCCRVPSDLVTVLRRLVIDRARGDIDMSAVLVAGEPADLARLEQDALADPFVAARYVVQRAR